MVLRLVEGMDNIAASADLTLRGYTGNVTTFSSTSGRWGGRGVYLGYSSGVQNLCFPLSGISGDTLVGAFAFKIAQTLVTQPYVFSVARGTTGAVQSSTSYSVFNVRCNANASNTLDVYNPAGTKVGSFVVTGGWDWIEFKTSALDSGSLQIKLNGNLVVDVTGDFAGTSATGTDWCLSFWHSGNQGNAYYLDDVLVADGSGTANNSWLGDCRIATLYPSTLDTAGSWTANTGTIPTAIDDTGTQDGTTTYITTTTADDTYRVGLGALPYAPTSILGIKTEIVAEKTGSDITTLTPHTKSGGTQTDEAAVSLSTSFLAYPNIRDTNPATGVAWTTSEINSLLVGAKAA